MSGTEIAVRYCPTRPGTEKAHGGLAGTALYGGPVSGTELAYGGTRCIVILLHYGMSGTDIGIVLLMHYAMSGTDIGVVLLMHCAMSGTDIGVVLLMHYAMSGTDIGVVLLMHYAMAGTEIGHVAGRRSRGLGARRWSGGRSRLQLQKASAINGSRRIRIWRISARREVLIGAHGTARVCGREEKAEQNSPQADPPTMRNQMRECTVSVHFVPEMALIWRCMRSDARD
eukprot:94856-Rhodomonas_salina.1